MNEKKKEDIFFDIAMQLYDEFNDKFCEIDDNLGTVYTYQDLEDLKQAEKDKEIKLLRKAIEKQQAEIEKKDKIIHLMARELKQRRYIFSGGRGYKFIIDFFTQKIEKGE